MLVLAVDGGKEAVDLGGQAGQDGLVLGRVLVRPERAEDAVDQRVLDLVVDLGGQGAGGAEDGGGVEARFELEVEGDLEEGDGDHVAGVDGFFAELLDGLEHVFALVFEAGRVAEPVVVEVVLPVVVGIGGDLMPPVDEVVAFLFAAQTQQQGGDPEAGADVVAAAEAEHVFEVDEGFFGGVEGLDLEDGVDVDEAGGQVVARLEDVPKMSDAPDEGVGVFHVVVFIRGVELLFQVLDFFELVPDSAAVGLVRVPVGALVVFAAVPDHEAARTAGEMLGGIADPTMEGELWSRRTLSWRVHGRHAIVGQFNVDLLYERHREGDR